MDAFNVSQNVVQFLRGHGVADLAKLESGARIKSDKRLETIPPLRRIHCGKIFDGGFCKQATGKSQAY